LVQIVVNTLKSQTLLDGGIEVAYTLNGFGCILVVAYFFRINLLVGRREVGSLITGVTFGYNLVENIQDGEEITCLWSKTLCLILFHQILHGI
jgi:hypothetical protein